MRRRVASLPIPADLLRGHDVFAEHPVDQPQVLGSLVVVPRSAHEAFGKGKKLTDVQALTFLWSGSSYPLGADRPVVDTTLVGKDFTFKG